MNTIQARTLTNRQITLNPDTLDDFAGRLRGELLYPDSEGYDAQRQVWNGMIDRRPALIACCTGTADVVAAVNFAREQGLLTAVRGGGHNVTGNAVCDGGLMIDLSPMKGIHVDPETRVAYAQGGVTWGDLDRETQLFGLAAPGGVVSMTGIAGLTLGGGLGWLRRKHGLSCDNLLAVELVTADGRVLTASDTQEPELFWGLKGGGGNFGVATSFKYQLHPVGPEVMFCFVFHPTDRAEEALRFYRDFTASAPEELSSFAIFGTVPDVPEFPARHHGKHYLLFAACYAGPVEEGQRVVQPLRDFGQPLADFSGPLSYVEVQSILDADYPAGELKYYWKSVHLRGLGDDAIRRIVELARQRPSPLSTLDVWHMGGAVSRVPPQASAFGQRDAPYLLGVESNWAPEAANQPNIDWTRRVCDELQAHSTGGSYLNFQESGADLVRAAHGEHYRRLAELKRRYDPDNLFRMNANIPPGDRGEP